MHTPYTHIFVLKNYDQNMQFHSLYNCKARRVWPNLLWCHLKVFEPHRPQQTLWQLSDRPRHTLRALPLQPTVHSLLVFPLCHKWITCNIGHYIVISRCCCCCWCSNRTRISCSCRRRCSVAILPNCGASESPAGRSTRRWRHRR